VNQSSQVCDQRRAGVWRRAGDARVGELAYFDMGKATYFCRVKLPVDWITGWYKLWRLAQRTHKKLSSRIPPNGSWGLFKLVITQIFARDEDGVSPAA
jgi:hypothetical protein